MKNMKASTFGYWLFFGTLVAAVLTKTPTIFIIGFVLGTLLVVVGEFREGNKTLVITSIVTAVLIGLMAFLKK